MADRELLQEIKDLMEEVRDEHRLNRAAYQQQTEVLLGIVQQNARAFVAFTGAIERFGERIDSFGERIESFGERIESFGERIESFGATLDLQREILSRFLDRLDEREPPQG